MAAAATLQGSTRELSEEDLVPAAGGLRDHPLTEYACRPAEAEEGRVSSLVTVRSSASTEKSPCLCGWMGAAVSSERSLVSPLFSPLLSLSLNLSCGWRMWGPVDMCAMFTRQDMALSLVIGQLPAGWVQRSPASVIAKAFLGDSGQMVFQCRFHFHFPDA